MACETLSYEQLVHPLSLEASGGAAEADASAKLAHELAQQSLAEQSEQDAQLARSLATLGSGVDQSLSRAHQQQQGPRTSASGGMLHVAAEIHEWEVDMLVDTGAEMSVISEQLASQLGLLAHLDRSRQGIANGVGQAKILGHVSNVPVKLGHVEFALTFSVLEMQRSSLLLLGLDQLRTYRCLVDLEKDRLVFGGHGGVEVPFVSTPQGGPTAPLDAVLIQARRAVDLFRHRDPDCARSAIHTLSQVLRNIKNHPAEGKYRRLKGTNSRIQQEVLAHPEAVELLRAAGFIQDGQDLVLPMGTPLNAVQKLTMDNGVLAWHVRRADDPDVELDSHA